MNLLLGFVGVFFISSFTYFTYTGYRKHEHSRGFVSIFFLLTPIVSIYFLGWLMLLAWILGAIVGGRIRVRQNTSDLVMHQAMERLTEKLISPLEDAVLGDSGRKFEFPELLPLREYVHQESKQRPTSCPLCGHAPVATIQYGTPEYINPAAIQAGLVKLGGSIISADSPDWACTRCGQPIHRSVSLDEPTYARQGKNPLKF